MSNMAKIQDVSCIVLPWTDKIPRGNTLMGVVAIGLDATIVETFVYIILF